MISKQEIMTYARMFNLPANTIEKDYVINWLLAGITQSKSLESQWIFKGGTCLKKCFFENYRFSEDLDFTLLDESHLSNKFLIKEFYRIAEWIYEESGIEVLTKRLLFEEYKNPRGKLSVQGKIAYIGPMQRRGSNPTVKLDLTSDELVVTKPIYRNIHHPYTDFVLDKLSIQTYSIQEIFAEKLRALIERMRPRDLYDVIHLYQDDRWQLSSKLVKDVLIKKCHFKKIAVPTMDLINLMVANKLELDTDWENMLAHQIASLESSHYYWNQLQQVFDWLYA